MFVDVEVRTERCFSVVLGFSTDDNFAALFPLVAGAQRSE